MGENDEKRKARPGRRGETDRIAYHRVEVIVVRGVFCVPALLALGWGCAVGGLASADGDRAARLAVERILPELAITGDYVAFLYPEPLDGDDELAPYAPTPIPETVGRLPHLLPYDLGPTTWFLWIDLRPYARYAHETLFVLVDGEDWTYAAHAETWWPVLNGESLWVDSEQYWDRSRWVASSLPAGRPHGESASRCEPDRPGSDYYDWALVVNGWSPGQPGAEGFAADTRGVCNALNDLGMRVSVLDPGAASPEALEDHVIRLFTEIPLYKCCDRLYFYFTCHASPGALWVGGARLSSTELARMLTFPGDTYVPSRVYVILETGYGGSFIPDLQAFSNINRVWTASAADEPAFGDVDSEGDPNPQDVGGEWTSSVLAALSQLMRDDPLAIRAAEFGREYMPLNMACREAGTFDAAAAGGASRPADYLFSDGRLQELLAKVEYLAHWDRAYRTIQGNLEETIERCEAACCIELLWFLNNMARHDSLPEPSSAFNARIGKGAAKDVAHSDWWTLCDVFWNVFAARDDAE